MFLLKLCGMTHPLEIILEQSFHRATDTSQSIAMAKGLQGWILSLLLSLGNLIARRCFFFYVCNCCVQNCCLCEGGFHLRAYIHPTGHHPPTRGCRGVMSPQCLTCLPSETQRPKFPCAVSIVMSVLGVFVIFLGLFLSSHPL